MMSEPKISKIEAVANVLGVTVEKLGKDVYGACSFIQASGNSGYSHAQMNSAAKREDAGFETYWMDKGVLGDALDGICWYSEPHRRSEYSGWFVKRRPETYEAVWAWKTKWLVVFGEEGDTAALILKELAEVAALYAAVQEHVARQPKREHKRSSLEEVPTVEVAHMWAASMLLAQYFYGVVGEKQKMRLAGRNFQRWMAAVWIDEANIMRQELEYRTEAEPQARSSKRKTEAARQDFRKAAEFLVAGREGIYSQAYVNAVLDAAFPFDLGADYEHLPEPAPENKLVRHMGDYELVNSFFRYLNADFDPRSFEYEDRQLLLKSLRMQLARMMGQKIESD